ncbi:GNAT family N-acetyltransferase [Paenibacillus oryzisoli]|uniref:N-acetyltransferase domain-containing protein n=1 Tax=Paenibacillus oryzisoli TaxID=1850517 RepID=A0A197ZYW8_9BACL|nr:GNAT family N-acetyltransferase [Paenibacillus oryzisoli]OAS14399.1 hypothetical protein A8708_13475 [Paenibacillus oryzisoli]
MLTAEKIKQNMIRIMKQMSAACPRITYVNAPGVNRYESDLPHSLFNRVIAYQCMESETAIGDIEVIASHYRARNLPFSWLVWSHDDEARDLARVLENLGLTKSSYSPGMSLPLSNWTFNTTTIPNFEIKPIRTTLEFAWFKEIVLPTFGLKGDTGDVFMQINEAIGTNDQTILQHYVGFLDGHPAGAATAFQEGDTIGIYNVATVEAYRRRGIGSAMTAHAIREGQVSGAQLAVLQSSELGVNVYRELGFKEEVAIEFYLG